MMRSLVLLLSLALSAGAQNGVSPGPAQTTPFAPVSFSLEFAASIQEFETKLNQAAADGYRVVDACAADTACHRLRYEELSVYLEMDKAAAKSEYRLLTTLEAKQLDPAAAEGFRALPGVSTFVSQTDPFSLWKLLDSFHNPPHMNSGRATYTVPVLLLEKNAGGALMEYRWIKSRPKTKSGRPRLDIIVKDIQPALDKGERLVWMKNEGFEALLERPAGSQNTSGKPAGAPALLLAGSRDELPKLITDAGRRGYRLTHIYRTSYGVLRRYFAAMEPAGGPHEYLFLKSELNAKEAFQQATAYGFRLVRSAILPNTVILEKAPGEARRYEYLIMAADKKSELEECVDKARGEGFRPVHMAVGPKIIANNCGSDANRTREWGVLMER